DRVGFDRSRAEPRSGQIRLRAGGTKHKTAFLPGPVVRSRIRPGRPIFMGSGAPSEEHDDSFFQRSPGTPSRTDRNVGLVGSWGAIGGMAVGGPPRIPPTPPSPARGEGTIIFPPPLRGRVGWGVLQAGQGLLLHPLSPMSRVRFSQRVGVVRV